MVAKQKVAALIAQCLYKITVPSVLKRISNTNYRTTALTMRYSKFETSLLSEKHCTILQEETILQSLTKIIIRS
jgi:hypothetical protein